LTWPLRAPPAFGAIVSATVPLALPLCPDETAIQLAVDAAVHAQPLSVATSNDERPPAAAIESDERLSVYRHGAGAWLSWTRCEPTAIVADRADGAGFAATENETTPLPCPSRADEIDTQAASADALHVQSRSVVTFTAPLPPAAGNGAAAELLTDN
jgi:hypothetical protein